ncbi:DUF2169 family type VI secretion system accessory protein [Pseudomonas mangiferae]|uniref:DUF2169 domain-containing protein n=1 Tax=Pseudomonas mangiferae TaxID=2593654 RepID=A0A553GTL0_9PSED|nr:DUF2169 domain-containing protein [Pseudomonas mangiferae]TRX72844.1 DUF2169 domain-containing protein [Pseudomonas mangiferae]
MDFHNLTPFAAQCFTMADSKDQEYRVAVLKVGYAIECLPGQTHARLRVLDHDPVSLCLTDEYWGPVGETSVKEESDLAPFKPRCDVILHGYAHAPGGQPARGWPVRLRLSEPAAELTKEGEVHRVLLDKTLAVRSPGIFREGPLGWKYVAGDAVARIPLRWEQTFGGHCQIPNEAHSRDPRQPEWLLNEACYANPLGQGWLEKRFFRLLERTNQPIPRVLPAPSLSYPGEWLDEPWMAHQPEANLLPRGMAEVASRYRYRPAGFGVVGRAWTPRLQRAGTYDARWLAERWPRLPQDFDFAYWNGAPLDQQIAWPSPRVRIELWNVLDPRYCLDGHVSLELPGHRAFFLAWFAGEVPFPIQPVIDTVLIDGDQRRVSLTWRCLIPAALPVHRLEARFETSPEAPLLKWAQSTATAKEA